MGRRGRDSQKIAREPRLNLLEKMRGDFRRGHQKNFREGRCFCRGGWTQEGTVLFSGVQG